MLQHGVEDEPSIPKEIRFATQSEAYPVTPMSNAMVSLRDCRNVSNGDVAAMLVRLPRSARNNTMLRVLHGHAALQ